jgi:hypothetical protein
MKRMVCKFPNLEKESLIPSGNEFTLDISLPENTGRGNTFYLNIFTQENLAITFNFEVVFRGRIESIQYLAPTVPKHKKNIDIVAPNSFYTLIFEGENMEFAMLNVPRMPYLLNGNFITLHSQTVGFNEKSWLLRIRTGKGEATLTTSLFYFLNKIGIKDKNADMDVPWVRYSIGSGHLINPMLPINPKSHLTDLSMLQLE